MSAPHTNTSKEVRRHRGPLLGMAAVLAFVAILFVGYLAYETDGGTPQNDTSGAPAVTDSSATPTTAPAADTITTPNTTTNSGANAADPAAETPTTEAPDTGGAAVTPDTNETN